MFKAQNRLRNQLIGRKVAESRELTRIKKKNQVLKAIESGDIKSIKATGLKDNELIEWDDEGADGILAQEDDEYQFAAIEDPRVLVTSSRDPSSLLKEFTKEIYHLIPNAKRVNRGNMTIDALMTRCLTEGSTDLVIVEENRGDPSSLIISHLPHGPTVRFTLSHVVPRHKMALDTVKEDGTKGHHKMPTQYPKICFSGMDNKLGKRLQDVLGYLFPVHKEESQRIICFAEQDDVISFCHFTHKTEKNSDGYKEMAITNQGPSFDMKVYKLFRGTLKDEDMSRPEFVVRPYMNTAGKRRFLSEK